MMPTTIDTSANAKPKSPESARVAEWTKQKKAQGFSLAKLWLLPDERELILALAAKMKALRPGGEP